MSATLVMGRARVRTNSYPLLSSPIPQQYKTHHCPMLSGSVLYTTATTTVCMYCTSSVHYMARERGVYSVQYVPRSVSDYACRSPLHDYIVILVVGTVTCQKRKTPMRFPRSIVPVSSTKLIHRYAPLLIYVHTFGKSRTCAYLSK